MGRKINGSKMNSKLSFSFCHQFFCLRMIWNMKRHFLTSALIWACLAVALAAQSTSTPISQASPEQLRQSYRYARPPPATVQILHDAAHPCRLLLPVLPDLPPLEDDEPAPLDQQTGLQELR